MDEGFNTFINGVSGEDFNAGEYNEKKFNMHRMSNTLTGDNLEPVYTAPDGMKERNMGVLAYMKPGTALDLLRNEVLGKERFDAAFKEYVKRWAYKHPTPDDFFRTMENVSGEDLGWFWRGWILNNWKIDQAIKSLKYVKNDPKNGALITIENLEKMAMPVVIEIEFKNGEKTNVNLPVEIWQRNTSWTFMHDSTEEIMKVTLDPKFVLPDSDSDNNVWKSENMPVAAPGKYVSFVGDYSSKEIPVKVSLFEENGVLMISGNGDSAPLEDKGNNTFVLEADGLEIKFNEDKKGLTLKVGPQSFSFTRD